MGQNCKSYKSSLSRSFARIKSPLKISNILSAFGIKLNIDLMKYLVD